MVLKLIVFSSFAALIYAQNSTSHTNVNLTSDILRINRVIGGTAAAKGEFPHQVSLQLGFSPFIPFHHICGGSIINEKWILTAAHCIHDLSKNLELIVRAGKTLIKVKESSEQTVFVEKIIEHPHYHGSVSANDIALLKLSTILKFNNDVRLINLPKADSLPKGAVILSGWGSISKGKTPVLPNHLQKATLTIVDLKTCRRAMTMLQQPADEIKDTNLCTGPLTGESSACHGDSGGPLIDINENGEREVVGIVSWGVNPCASVGAPAVFVRVSAYIDWIYSTMSKN